MRPLSLFDRARCVVDYGVVFGEADQCALAETILVDLGFDDLLLAMKAIRELKATGAPHANDISRRRVRAWAQFNNAPLIHAPGAFRRAR